MAEGKRLFTSYGLKKVTIDDLSASAHIAKASYYTSYENKEALYLDIVQGIQQKILLHPDFILAENTSCSGKIRVKQVFGCMYQQILKYPILGQLDTRTAILISPPGAGIKDWPHLLPFGPCTGAGFPLRASRRQRNPQLWISCWIEP